VISEGISIVISNDVLSGEKIEEDILWDDGIVEQQLRLEYE
jgi:hypothetical protein